MLVFYHRNLSQGKLSSILRLSQVYQNMVLKFNCYAMKHLKLGIFKHLQVFRSEVLAGLNWMFFFRSHTLKLYISRYRNCNTNQILCDTYTLNIYSTTIVVEALSQNPGTVLKFGHISANIQRIKGISRYKIRYTSRYKDKV